MSSLPELSKMVSVLSAKHQGLALTVSSNQDHYINADKAKYNSEKVLQILPAFIVIGPSSFS